MEKAASAINKWLVREQLEKHPCDAASIVLYLFKNETMKRQLIILALSFLLFSNVVAQSVVVNPDGTHSVIIDNGQTSTVVNPNGTHSTIIKNGNTSTIVNPNGTHSIIIDNGSTSTIVNPNGSHSTISRNGKAATIMSPTGAYSTIMTDDESWLFRTLLIKNLLGNCATDSLKRDR